MDIKQIIKVTIISLALLPFSCKYIPFDESTNSYSFGSANIRNLNDTISTKDILWFTHEINDSLINEYGIKNAYIKIITHKLTNDTCDYDFISDNLKDNSSTYYKKIGDKLISCFGIRYKKKGLFYVNFLIGHFENQNNGNGFTASFNIKKCNSNLFENLTLNEENRILLKDSINSDGTYNYFVVYVKE